MHIARCKKFSEETRQAGEDLLNKFANCPDFQLPFKLPAPGGISTYLPDAKNVLGKDHPIRGELLRHRAIGLREVPDEEDSVELNPSPDWLAECAQAGGEPTTNVKWAPVNKPLTPPSQSRSARARRRKALKKKALALAAAPPFTEEESWEEPEPPAGVYSNFSSKAQYVPKICKRKGKDQNC